MKKSYLSRFIILSGFLLGYSMSLVAQTTTFSYTGAVQTYQAPLGGTGSLLGIDAIGGAGGYPYYQCGNSVSASLGGRVQCTITVSPGQTLYIYVGSKGADDACSGAGGSMVLGGFNGGQNSQFYGGASGGATDIRLTPGTISGTQVLPYTTSNRIVVAGGGGGGADWYGTGGAGGGLSGGTGTIGTSGGTPGAGGTQGGPGVGGGTSGSLGIGGVASSYGPGGGGYYGGNGGSGVSGGGGGGSSYTDASICSSVIHTQGYTGANGNGRVSITVLCTPPTSGPISGPSLICPAVSYSFTTTSTTGGTWSSTNTSVATVNGTTGVVTGVAPGTATISYSFVLSCGSALVGKTITVNTPPVAITGNSACLGLTVPLSDATPGGKWSSSNTTSLTINSTTGVMNGVALGTSIITYQVTSTSCFSTKAETVNPLPNIYTTGIVGSGTYCSGGTGFHITMSNTDAGVSYQLYNAGVALGAAATGSGSPYDFGLETLGGSYTVKATNIASQCPIAMAGAPTITVNPLPTQYSLSVSNAGHFCSGGTGVDIQLMGSDPGINYQLYNGAASVGAPLSSGTGAILDFGLQTGGGTYTVVGTNASTTCTGNMLNSVTVNVDPLPNIYTITNGGSYCSGGNGVHVGLSGSDAGINYLLYVGGVSSGVTRTGSGSAIDFGLITMAGVCSVVATNPVSGCTVNMSGSVSVAINALPSPYAVTGGGNYCSGGAGQHVGLFFSGSSGVMYYLYRNAVLIDSLAGTGGALDFGPRTVPGVPGSVGTFTVMGINTTTQCSSPMPGNAMVIISLPPSLYLISGGGPYCAGGTGATVRLGASDIGTSYQLQLAGAAIGAPVPGTGSSFSFGPQKASGSYTAVATSGSSGCSATMNGSVNVSINPAPNPYAILTPTGSSYCADVAGTQVKLNNSDVGIRYQIYNGATALTDTQALRNGTGLQLDFGIRAAGNYTIIGTNAITNCMSSMPGSPTITINPLPLIDTVTGGGSYCTSGSGTHIGLSYSTIGVNYQLLYTGSAIGSPLAGTGGPLDFGLETGIGNYTVTAKNAATQCMSIMSGSTTVSTTPLPIIYAVTGGGSYCAGSGGMRVGLGASNTGINYQLYNGVVPVGGTVHGTGLSLDFGLQSITGTYSVIATNASTSCTSNMLGNAIVNVNLLPSIYSVTGGGNYCIGGSGKDVSITNSDIGTNYQLYNGSVKAGGMIMGTGSGIDFGNKTISGTYVVQAVDAITGCSIMQSGNAMINTIPLPGLFTVSGGGAFCAGGTGAHVYLNGSNAGVNYDLYDNSVSTGIPSAAGTGGKLDFGSMTTGGNYTVVATDAVTGCTNNMLSLATVIVNALPDIDTVTGGGSYCAGGTGLVVGLNTSSLGVTYQLSAAGSAMGLPVWGSGSSLLLGVYTGAGSYSVTAMNEATGCTSSMYSTVGVTILPVVTPSVSIVTDLGLTVCDGSTVTYSATPVNGGIAPTYAWYVNGVLVPGANTDSFMYMPLATGDVITGKLLSNASCPVPSSASNSARMTVNPHGAPDVTIGKDPVATICKGTSVTLSATLPVFGGTAPVYTWTKGGSPVGTGDTYSYVPNDNDVVSLEMASNDLCSLSPSVTKSITLSVQSPVAPVFTIKSKSGSLVLGSSDTLQVVITSNGGPSPMYQWVVNGTPVPGATKSTFVSNNLFNGDSVACIVTGSGECGGLPASHSVIMTIHGLSVGQVSGTGMDIRVIPNPNRGAFAIKGNTGDVNDGAVSIEVSNMLGQVVYHGTAMTHGGQLDAQVQLEGGISNGMYLLNIISGSAHTVFHFVVEQ